MRTDDGNNVICCASSKVCYTEREAGMLINNTKKHHYMGNKHWSKGSYGNSKEVPKRKYFCKDCGFFHVTHKPLYDKMSRNGEWEENFYQEYKSQKRA